VRWQNSFANPPPSAVRFAWDESAHPNFFNQASLPAEPFRTDEPKK
jgi:sialate O-acetylesterase